MNDQILLLCGRLFRQASRYSMYALRAAKDQRPELALLFSALAESHSRQANRFLMQVRGFIGNSTGNVDTAVNRDLPFLIETFDTLRQQAGSEQEQALATGADHSARIARMNHNLIRQLTDTPRMRDYFVCDFCGFVAPDKPPDHCPICTAPRKRFISFSADD